MTRYVFILGSLDTKGAEVGFLRQKVLDEGGQALVVDTGVLGDATIPADIDRQTVASAGGGSIQELIEAGDKSHALVVMANGASRLLGEYLARGELGGVLSIGGSRGTALGTQVMQTLPVGVPKYPRRQYCYAPNFHQCRGRHRCNEPGRVQNPARRAASVICLYVRGHNGFGEPDPGFIGAAGVRGDCLPRGRRGRHGDGGADRLRRGGGCFRHYPGRDDTIPCRG
jgi:hypothetical protein